MGKNLRNRSERKPIWVQHMWKGKWADYRDFATLEAAESWVLAQLHERDRHAGAWPPAGYRIRSGRRIVSGFWYPPATVEEGGWVNVPGLGSVRPMLARAYAESLLQTCDAAEGKTRPNPGPLIEQALKVALHWKGQDGVNAAVIDGLAHEADQYWQCLKESLRS